MDKIALSIEEANILKHDLEIILHILAEAKSIESVPEQFIDEFLRMLHATDDHINLLLDSTQEESSSKIAFYDESLNDIAADLMSRMTFIINETHSGEYGSLGVGTEKWWFLAHITILCPIKKHELLKLVLDIGKESFDAFIKETIGDYYVENEVLNINNAAANAFELDYGPPWPEWEVARTNFDFNNMSSVRYEDSGDEKIISVDLDFSIN